ncbi:MAG: rhamnulokinase [Kiritimatiellia bacterium]
MAEKKLFAVDLGASGGKCFVGFFGDDGSFRMEEIHRFAHEGVPFFLADRTGEVTERTYWDDTAIYQQILRGLQAYRRTHGPHLDGIGIDTWGADGMVVSKDGDQLGKVYCYRDHRLDNMVEEVKSLVDPAEIYTITGIHFQPFNLNNQLRWFCTRRPDLLKVGAKFLPIPTLFYYYLGGCTQVDSTFASITQLMDARRRVWSRKILKKLGIPARLLPEIVDPGTTLGALRPELASMLGLNEAPLFAVGSHDTASAFAAAPVKNTRKALVISSGTWSLVGRLVRKPITNDAAFAANASNEGGIGNIRFLRNCMGTWIVQELLRVWEIADGRRMEWEEVDTITPAARPFAGFIDPDDARFFNPANMEEAVCGYLAETNQPVPAGRGELLRIVYESLALAYRRVDELLAAAIGRPTDVCHIVGGGSSNVLLNQFTANALGKKVLAGPKEGTAVGNLMVQAVAAGILPSIADAQPLIRAAFPIREFKPRDTGAWDAAYAKFMSAAALAAR